ncbi:MAG: ABC transporter ATP-binding protein [Firmicutes bacterium]|nr:ABC transporter ATP-binding protein [Bacillota bacterium]
MLKVENLCKTFTGFQLKNVSFEIPEGVIVGFLGQNGAGKTTTLKCIMQSVLPDSGSVNAFGMDMAKEETSCKKLIAFCSGAFEYYRNKKLRQIAYVYKMFYDNWNQEDFDGYVVRFDLDLDKRVKELSAGMKVKFALTLAMSHDAKLFIFDEPTSGLDPIARDELLDVFRDIVNDGDKSILFSTHITSDLDKCADYVLFIKNGEIVLDSEKDELLDSHALVKGGSEELTEQLTDRLVSYKQNKFGYSALIRRENINKGDKFVTEKPTLDDIMIYYSLSKQVKNESLS